jgi:hypothetical protein
MATTWDETHAGDMRIPWRAVAAVAGLLVVGFLLGRASATHRTVTLSRPAPALAPAVSPHTRDGATAAGLAAVNELANGVATVPAADLAALWVPAKRAEMTASLQRSADYIHTLNGDSTLTRGAIVGYHLESYDGAHATLKTWHVELAGGRTTGVTSSWSTGTIDLEWMGGRWLLTTTDATGTSTAGPAPDSPLTSAGVVAAVESMEVPHVAP